MEQCPAEYGLYILTKREADLTATFLGTERSEEISNVAVATCRDRQKQSLCPKLTEAVPLANVRQHTCHMQFLQGRSE